MSAASSETESVKLRAKRPRSAIMTNHGPTNVTSIVARLATTVAATRRGLGRTVRRKTASHHFAQNGAIASPAKLVSIITLSKSMAPAPRRPQQAFSCL